MPDRNPILEPRDESDEEHYVPGDARAFARMKREVESMNHARAVDVVKVKRRNPYDDRKGGSMFGRLAHKASQAASFPGKKSTSTSLKTSVSQPFNPSYNAEQYPATVVSGHSRPMKSREMFNVGPTAEQRERALNREEIEQLQTLLSGYKDELSESPKVARIVAATLKDLRKFLVGK